MSVVPKAEQGKLGETVRLRIDDDFMKRIDAVCEETGRKRSDVMRRLMMAGLELHEAGAKKTGKR